MMAFVPPTLTESKSSGFFAQKSKKLARWKTISHPASAFSMCSGRRTSPTIGSAPRFRICATPATRRTRPTTALLRRTSAETSARPSGLAAPVTNTRMPIATHPGAFAVCSMSPEVGFFWRYLFRVDVACANCSSTSRRSAGRCCVSPASTRNARVAPPLPSLQSADTHNESPHGLLRSLQ